MESFLMYNDYEIAASMDEQVEIILGVASGRIGRDTFTDWLREHIIELS